MATKVNLDALIPREDFEVVEETSPGTTKTTISIEDLKRNSFFFSNVRKPDFQRETNEWDSNKIVEFLTSFVDCDLIPAIILWRNKSGLLFVIDGSHRLSSLAAWINDDYGDGEASKLFYDGVIPDEQIDLAERTRKIVRKRVGSFADYQLANSNPEKVHDDIKIRAKKLASLAIQLQWVEGDASKAEHSFFKINQQVAPINETELVLLKSRRKPNCISARAIISSGKGHKYWSEFVPEIQSQIQSLAYEINEILFSPKLITPIKTAVEAVANRTWPQQSAVRIATAIEPARVATAGYEMEVEMEVDLEKVEQAQIQAAEKLKATGLHVSTATRVGDPKRFLIDETERWGADAIFIGARGHRFIERVLLGSVSYAIAARAHCSVEVVRSGR